MNRGYFPVFRKIFDSDIWGHKVARDVWIFILGNVAHNPTKLCANYGCVNLLPGQMVTGIDSLAKRNRFSVREIRTSLNYLQSTGRITRETTNKYSVITVLNWDTYRDAQNGNDKQNDTPDRQADDKQTTSRRQHIRSKEVKNRSKPMSEYTPEFISFWEEYPRKIGKQYAFECFTRVLKIHTASDVIGAAVEFAIKCDKNKTEEKFIPHPSSFLNKGSWKDYCLEEVPTA